MSETGGTSSGGRAGRGGRGGGGGGRGRGRGRGRGGGRGGGGGGGGGGGRNTNNNPGRPSRGGGRHGGGGNPPNAAAVTATGGGRGGRGRGGRTNDATNTIGTAAGTGTGRYARSSSFDPPSNKKQLKNGEKGADAHTVSEADRIRLTKTLMHLREGDETQLAFPPTLTNTERKFLHELASQLGLVSKSTGKGDTRHIVVSKRGEQTKKATTGDSGSGLPILQIGKPGVQALRQHMSKFPPTHADALESVETGASLVEAYTHAVAAGEGEGGDEEAHDARIAATLKQLGLGQEERIVMAPIKPKYVNLDQRRARHAAFQKAKLQSPYYSRMTQQRNKLPAYSRQEEIVATVAKHPVTIIQGETGCGKSTQCPQFLLDANPAANIVVTQPRRISAISIADRVAQEQCLTQGNNNSGVGSLVGYQVRLEAATTKDTQLMFVTPGILLRKLQSSPTLSEFTHIIIDEVHERDKYTEFLLITLRDLLPVRPDLRLVLMSATLQTELLIDYFASCEHDFYQQHPPGVLEIEGRTFPVQEFFLEHVLELTGYIDPAVAAAAAGGEGGNANNNNNVMSMEDLDAELAKLLGPASTPSAPVETMTVQCPMCNRQFADHVALGGHVALCQGNTTASENDLDVMIADPEFINGDGNHTLALPPTQLLTPDLLLMAGTSGDDNLQEFDDYDVDETVQIDGYEFQASVAIRPAVSSQYVEEVVDDDKKWDGIGMFLKPEEDAEEVIEVTPQQDALLNHYQTMHDDEKVDNDLLLDVLHYIHKSSHGDGAILVFMPGWQEISEFSLLLESTPPFHDNSRFLVLPLHSGIPSADQRRVLQRPPTGTRKIVLSTNIAETSLTIEDVSFVVDTGRAKEKNYDPHLKTSTLQPTWISQASAKQRKGRAGRTKAGVCFHMFSSRRYQFMRPFVESELLRTPLEEMCLFTKKLGLAPGGPEDIDGVPAFLAKAITPPHEKSVSNALELLVDLGAMLPETNDLTNLGQCLSILSLEPRVGKMVIWSYLLGCSRVTSQMAVAMSYKSPFALPPPHLRRSAEKAQVELSQGSESDQVTIYNTMVKQDQIRKTKPESAWRDFCRRNFLNPATMQMVSELRKNIARELTSLNFPDPMKSGGFHNRNQNKEALWQAALSAGLYPNVCTRQRGEVNFSTMTNRKCKIHISSINAVKGQPLSNKCQIPEGEVEFVCFGEMVKGARMFTISQTTHLASPLPLLLLCGTALAVHPDPDDNKFAILGLDDWIIFRCHTDVAAGLVVLRKRLDAAFLKALAQPSLLGDQNMDERDRDAIDALGQILQSALKSTTVR